MVDIAATLEERGSRYGDFTEHARISAELRDVVCRPLRDRGYTSSDNLPPFVVEGIFMICHKLARVANGDPLYADNFVDIAGYAKLVADRLAARTASVEE